MIILTESKLIDLRLGMRLIEDEIFQVILLASCLGRLKSFNSFNSLKSLGAMRRLCKWFVLQ